MKSGDPRKLWDSGTLLKFAWYVFAPERMRRQYQEDRAAAAHVALRKIMESETAIAAADGRLVALGFQTAPVLSEGPVIIDPAMFEAAEIDWDDQVVSALGRKYELVRLVSGPTAAPMPPAISTSQPVRNSGKVPQGRPRTRELVDEIVTELGSMGAFDGLLVKERMTLVRAKSQARQLRNFLNERMVLAGTLVLGQKLERPMWTDPAADTSSAKT